MLCLRVSHDLVCGRVPAPLICTLASYIRDFSSQVPLFYWQDFGVHKDIIIFSLKKYRFCSIETIIHKDLWQIFQMVDSVNLKKFKILSPVATWKTFRGNSCVWSEKPEYPSWSSMTDKVIRGRTIWFPEGGVGSFVKVDFFRRLAGWNFIFITFTRVSFLCVKISRKIFRSTGDEGNFFFPSLWRGWIFFWNSCPVETQWCVPYQHVGLYISELWDLQSMYTIMIWFIVLNMNVPAFSIVHIQRDHSNDLETETTCKIRLGLQNVFPSNF